MKKKKRKDEPKGKDPFEGVEFIGETPETLRSYGDDDTDDDTETTETTPGLAAILGLDPTELYAGDKEEPLTDEELFEAQCGKKSARNHQRQNAMDKKKKPIPGPKKVLTQTELLNAIGCAFYTLKAKMETGQIVPDYINAHGGYLFDADRLPEIRWFFS